MPISGEDECPRCGEIQDDIEYELYQMQFIFRKQGPNMTIVVSECPRCKLVVVAETFNEHGRQVTYTRY